MPKSLYRIDIVGGLGASLDAAATRWNDIRSHAPSLCVSLEHLFVQADQRAVGHLSAPPPVAVTPCYGRAQIYFSAMPENPKKYEILQALCGHFGDVESIKFCNPSPSAPNRRSGFIVMKEWHAADAVVQELNGKRVGSAYLKAKMQSWSPGLPDVKRGKAGADVKVGVTATEEARAQLKAAQQETNMARQALSDLKVAAKSDKKKQRSRVMTAKMEDAIEAVRVALNAERQAASLFAKHLSTLPDEFLLSPSPLMVVSKEDAIPEGPVQEESFQGESLLWSVSPKAWKVKQYETQFWSDC